MRNPLATIQAFAKLLAFAGVTDSCGSRSRVTIAFEIKKILSRKPLSERPMICSLPEPE